MVSKETRVAKKRAATRNQEGEISRKEGNPLQPMAQVREPQRKAGQGKGFGLRTGDKTAAY